MNKYDDIINIEHFEPKNHVRMSIASRASIFAPFAALTGYSDEIAETSRITYDKILLDENSKIVLDRKINIIKENLDKKLEINIKYFIKDNKKSGGKYLNKTGYIKKINLVDRIIVLNDNTKINIDDIIDIDGYTFNNII